MWWFGNDKNKNRNKNKKEIWEEDASGPLGDIEAAERIRNICRSAADSAEKVGSFAIGTDGPTRKPDQKKHESEAERYARAARAAMEIAMKVSDDLMRDSAVGQIVDLCVRANDLKTARILFRAIQADSVRDDVLNQHPVLRK